MLVWKIPLAVLALIILVSAAHSAISGEAMFGIEKVTAYPFSEFDAQVVDKDGNPVVNAKVRRTYDWDGKINEAVTYTDENGRFHFDSVSVQFRQVISQFVSVQRIYVYVDGEEYMLWGASKLNTDEFDEYENRVSPKTCVLTHDYSTKALKNDTLIATTCK